MSWSVDNSSGVNVWIVDEDGQPIAPLPLVGSFLSREKQLKRAKQIAAVPELIALCRQARANIANQPWHGDARQLSNESLVSKLDAALAKAGGGS